jgi:tRNA A22 N-methylase
MASSGRPRRELLVRLARTGPEPRVDVGADHGMVAEAIGAIATERQRISGRPRGLPWVVADGLSCFGPLGTVVIAGMGARSIARILAEGPPIERGVLHAQDDPPLLRTLVAAQGFRIVEEGLAREAGRFAEAIVVEPGDEEATGLWLAYGPVLLRSHDPLLVAHLAQLAGHLERLAEVSRPSPDVHALHRAHLAFVGDRLAEARARLS